VLLKNIQLPLKYCGLKGLANTDIMPRAKQIRVCNNINKCMLREASY